MNPKLIYNLSAYLSIVIGALAATCIFKMGLLKYGIALAMLGFIISGVNIFLNTKYSFDEEKLPKGYLGMFLSSLPVLFLMVMIFKFKSS